MGRRIVLLAVATLVPLAAWAAAPLQGEQMSDVKPAWSAFRLADLEDRRQGAGRLYLEFLKVPALSAGLYELAAGAKDPQGPHAQDEMYYVVSGKASFVAGGETAPVEAGSVLYVAAGVEHRFEEIEEPLKVLVFFAPAED